MSFLNYINYISDTHSHLIYGVSGSGLTTLAYEIANEYANKYNNILLCVEDTQTNFFTKLINDNNLSKISVINIIDFKIEMAQNFDCILLDKIEHLIDFRVQSENDLALRPMGATVRIINIIARELNSTNTPFFIFKNIRDNHQSISRSLLYMTANVFQIHKSNTNLSSQKRTIKVTKSRLFPIGDTFEFQIPSNDFSFIKHEVKSKDYYLFGIPVNKYPDSIISDFINIETPFEEYFSFLSQKRRSKLKDFLYQQIFNFNLLNIMELLRKHHPAEFNIDDFLLDDRFLKISHKTDIIKFKYADDIEHYLQHTPYKRTLLNIKNQLSQEPKNILFLINIPKLIIRVQRECELLKDQYPIQLTNFRKFMTTKINKLSFKKQYEILKDFDDKNSIYEKLIIELNIKDKQTEWCKLHNKIVNKHNIKVPTSFDEIYKMSKHFNNCTAGSSFLYNFQQDDTVIFYLNYLNKDYCIHINKFNKIIEIKGINNAHVDRNIESALQKILYSKELTD